MGVGEASTQKLSGRVWASMIEASLTEAQDALTHDVMQRNPELFESLLTGKAGVGGTYDLWRRFKSLVKGKSFSAEHKTEIRSQ
jgi:hypothetical protein